jgi:hypothetical protein
MLVWFSVPLNSDAVLRVSTHHFLKSLPINLSEKQNSSHPIHNTRLRDSFLFYNSGAWKHAPGRLILLRIRTKADKNLDFQ